MIRRRYILQNGHCDNSVTLFMLYGKIYNGDIECYLKTRLENYDVDKLWAETTATSNNIHAMEELARTPLDFTISYLEENRKKVFITFHPSEYSQLNPMTSGGSSTSVIDRDTVYQGKRF